MSEEKTNKPPLPESQHQRWIKYGANVAVACVVVVVLAIVVTYLADVLNRRIDTTTTGLYSLKPQTVNIIKDNKSKIRLVSLYTPIAGAATDAARAQAEEHASRTEAVNDLLDEYRRKGKNIDVEIIDPVATPQKVDALVAEVTSRYGGEVQKYKEAVADYGKVYDQIAALAKGELPKIGKLPLSTLAAAQRGAAADAANALYYAQDIPETLDKSRKRVDRRLGEKIPDYKLATEQIQSAAESLSANLAELIAIFGRAKSDLSLPEPVRQYATDSVPTYEQMKTLADDLATRIKGLGELKLDAVRQKLDEKDAILVLGEKDMRALSYNQVWRTDAAEVRRLQPGQEIKPRFAGEQQITSAILSLTSETKPKVVFVRPGGPPLASPGFPPFQPGGPLSEIAARLREYNFDVLEKDLSGMWAMQQQMRGGGMPPEPEPSDEEIKDAVWIVLSFPTQQQGMMGMPPPTIAPKVAAHLKAGGSALLLFLPNSEDMAEALKEYGISVDTGAIVVKEVAQTNATPTADFIEEAQRSPFIFVTNDYGEHLLAKPLASLDSLLIPILPVKTTAAEGAKNTPLLPLPTTPKSWAERDVESTLQGNPVTFDESAGDVPGPVFGGAAGERDGAGRVVAIGSLQFATNQIIALPDPDMLRRGLLVARFPGNAELIANSVFWLAKMEPMIAISPAAMEVSRIEPMSPGALRVWRIGGLLIGLPGAVILAGTLVYFMRRD
jgi:hypothetical protein